MRRRIEQLRLDGRKRNTRLRNEKIVHIDGKMETIVVGMSVAFMAMFAAIVGIRVAEAYFRRPAQAQRHIEDGRGAYRRVAELSQCAQNTHGVQIYQILSRGVNRMLTVIISSRDRVQDSTCGQAGSPTRR